MNQQSPDTVTSIRLALKLPNVSPQVVSQMEEYLAGNNIYTKKEGNKNHVNAFFLPFDKELGRIYLGHHKKADDWIPPGGHIEPGETPEEACIREMQEELSTTIKKHDLELWNLSYIKCTPLSTHSTDWFKIHSFRSDRCRLVFCNREIGGVFPNYKTG